MPAEAAPEPHSSRGHFLVIKWLATISCSHSRHIHKDVQKWAKGGVIRVMSMKRQPSDSLCISACGPDELPETVHGRRSNLFLDPRVAWRCKHECCAQKDPLRAAAAGNTVWKAMLFSSCHIGQNIRGKLFKHKNTISCLSEYAWVTFLFMILDKRGYK